MTTYAATYSDGRTVEIQAPSRGEAYVKAYAMDDFPRVSLVELV